MGKFMDFVDTKGGGAAIGAAGNFLDSTIGAIADNQRETQEANRQKEFMQIQKDNQMDLNRQGQELAMQTWNDTNYGAQMDHIKEAGLNPALLYGKGGAGGATTAAGSGGSAQAGKAPQAKSMDIGNTAQSMAQLSLLGAQRDNIEADTDNKIKTGNNQYEQSEDRRMKNENYKVFGRNADSAEDMNRRNEAKAKGLARYGETADWEGGYEFNDKFGKGKNRAEQEYINDWELSKGDVDKQREEINLIKQNISNAVSTKNLTDEKAREVWHSINQKWTALGVDGAKMVIGLVTRGTPVKQAIETVTKTKYSKDGPKGLEYGHSTTTRTQK